jgi:hypothetical protein
MYIRIASLLRPTMVRVLHSLFDPANVLIAPIKDVKRCIAKMEDILIREGRPSPGAVHIIDYLRATILCDSVEGVIEALETLSTACQHIEIVRIKDRLLDGADGNKVLLVNVIVKDPVLKPRSYGMFQPGWWDNRTVEMICEIQIAVWEMYNIDKQFHTAYHMCHILFYQCAKHYYDTLCA